LLSTHVNQTREHIEQKLTRTEAVMRETPLGQPRHEQFWTEATIRAGDWGDATTSSASNSLDDPAMSDVSTVIVQFVRPARAGGLTPARAMVKDNSIEATARTLR
jgi:hypothetical protein